MATRLSGWADMKVTAAFALNVASHAVGVLPHEATGRLSAACGGLHRATSAEARASGSGSETKATDSPSTLPKLPDEIVGRVG
ncbi:hypothetical protein ACF1DY_13430 [Streptomyces albus]